MSLDFLQEEKTEEVKPVYEEQEWLKAYYTEPDADKRDLLLKERESVDNSTQTKLLRELYSARYKKRGKMEHADMFIGAWVELQVAGASLDAVFGKQRSKKNVENAYHALQLDKIDYYGQTTLYRELFHLVACYISLSMNDKTYRSVFLGFGKIKDEKAREKVHQDIKLVTHTVPDNFKMTDEFEILTKAAKEAYEISFA